MAPGADKGAGNLRMEEPAHPASSQVQGGCLQDDTFSEIANFFLDVPIIHISNEGNEGRGTLYLAIGADRALKDLCRRMIYQCGPDRGKGLEFPAKDV
jgi:hypothetical protein